jgi:hypothetical protein
MIGGGQDLQQTVDFGHGGAGELFRIGEQDTGAVGPCSTWPRMSVAAISGRSRLRRR